MVQGTDDQDASALRARLHALEAEVARLKDDNERLARSERASQAQHQVLQAVLDESPDVIVVKDHEGNFMLGNKVVAQIYGTTPEAMVGKHDGDFSATPEQAEFFRQNVLGIMARMQTEIVLEQTTDDKTGEVRSFRSIKKPFQGPDGLPRILVIAHDVTDLQRAQARVAESEQRLQYVMAATGEGVWDWDVRTGALLRKSWFRAVQRTVNLNKRAVSQGVLRGLPLKSGSVLPIRRFSGPSTSTKEQFHRGCCEAFP